MVQGPCIKVPFRTSSPRHGMGETRLRDTGPSHQQPDPHFPTWMGTWLMSSGPKIPPPTAKMLTLANSHQGLEMSTRRVQESSAWPQRRLHLQLHGGVPTATNSPAKLTLIIHLFARACICRMVSSPPRTKNPHEIVGLEWKVKSFS